MCFRACGGNAVCVYQAVLRVTTLINEMVYYYVNYKLKCHFPVISVHFHFEAEKQRHAHTVCMLSPWSRN
jgi:hypothetical protein